MHAGGSCIDESSLLNLFVRRVAGLLPPAARQVGGARQSGLPRAARVPPAPGYDKKWPASCGFLTPRKAPEKLP